MNTSKFLRRKESPGKNLGNRASPVDQTLMKRPSDGLLTYQASWVHSHDQPCYNVYGKTRGTLSNRITVAVSSVTNYGAINAFQKLLKDGDNS